MPNRGPDDELLAAALSAGSDCPPLEELEHLLDEQPPPPLKQHLDRCLHCQTELQMLRLFTSAEVAERDKQAVDSIAARLKARSTAVGTERTAIEGRESWWRLILAARWLTPAAVTLAVALFVTGVAIELRQGRQPALDTTTGGAEVYRSSTIAILTPLGDLRQKPTEIRWEAASNAVRYRVRIMEVDRVVLWSTETTAASVELPGTVKTLILPTKTLLVQVSAFDAAGGKIADSEAVRFRLLQSIYTH